MAVADRMTGANLYVEWVNGSGTVSLTGDARSLDITREQEVADITAGADGARSFKATVKMFEATLETLYIGTAGSATYTQVDIGAEGTLRYYPKGTASGNPKGAFPAVVTVASLPIPYDDAVIITVEFQPQGDEIWNPLTDKV